MVYATVEDIRARMTRNLSADEEVLCSALLEDIAVVIDSYNADASDDAKKIVSCRAIIRILGDGSDAGIPVGASEGSMSALGYAQSWKIGSGSAGELYLSKLERSLLGERNKVGFTTGPIGFLTSEEA